MQQPPTICINARMAVISLVLFAVSSSPAAAALITFVDRASFDAAGPVNLIDFESASTGTVSDGSTLSGITFSYNFGGVNLTVEDLFETTSGTKYLGTDDGGVLQDGDNLTFSFSPAGGFGLYIISQDPLLDGDFTLTSGAVTASLSAASIQQTLGDGSAVWFLGIRSNSFDAFSTAVLETHGGGGAFLYNLDDIATANVTAVPEPSSALLFSIAAGMFVGRRFRLSRTQRKSV